MMTDFRQILLQYWGYPDFRGIQREIIESVAAGHDTLGLMPTGGGKSITFQVPALAMEGLCLVITPLIALMRDQVDNLRRRNIRAAAVYSGMSREEIGRTLDNAVCGGYDFLYVSPERLVTEGFTAKVRHMKVCLITVDEAHCISQWGYDFRPEYLRIGEVRAALPDVPVLALTATATPRVVDDIQDRLGFREHRVYRMSFARPNLRYIVRGTDEKLQTVVDLIRRVPGSAIVYTRSRRATREVAEMLNAQGISALHFHAGLSSLDKETRQRAWQEDRVRVMVATNAFGMGIDKPDVRLVVHYNVPDSVEAYFQEAGRAGRDGETAYAVLLYGRRDAQILSQRVAQTFPERDYIRKVYQDLANYYQIAEGEAAGRTFDFHLDDFCRRFHHHAVRLVSALELLGQAGYVRFVMEDTSSSRVLFVCRRDDLYGVDYLSPTEERVINDLLRKQTGLFADYVNIEEDRIGEALGLTPHEVYEILCRLTRYRLINYVPRKHCPQLTYLTRRIDAEEVQIPRTIYEDRRDLYRERIRAMIGYFTEHDLCRSRYLLHYFADDAPDCGHCDVCCLRGSAPEPVEASLTAEAARTMLLEALADGLPHELADLALLPIPDVLRGEALQTLVSDGRVTTDGLRVRMKAGKG